VNNAAHQELQDKLEDWTTESFDRTFKTNVYAMFWLCKEFVPRMKAGSSIINISSIQGFRPEEHLLPYAATKAAINNFTKALARLVADKGIRVNCVAPGPVWTPLIPTSMDEEKVRTFGQQTIFGRPAQPAEIAPTLVFLSTDDARYISGEIFPITGGQTPV
jgi:hypothetical protein